MSELTVLDLREKLSRDLDLARERVRTLEEQLKWFDNAMAEDISDPPSTSEVKDDEQAPLLAAPNVSEENTVGKAIRETMVNAPGQFNVPGVVKAVQKDFPDIDYKELSRKGSQIAGRLAKPKVGKIKLVEKGKGRKPNTYVSAKYSDN